jgi:hypothetical protein
MAAMLITRRKDQADFKKSGKSCPEQIIGGVLFCGSDEGREAWIRRLNRHPSRFNHFVCFRDVQSPFALAFGFAEWKSVDCPYILR